MNWSKGWSIGIAAVVVGLTTLGVGYWAGRRTPTASAPTTVAPPAAPTATVRPQPVAPAVSAPPAAPALTTVEQAIARQERVEARQLCQQLLQEHPESPAAAQAQQRMGDINVQLLFHPSSAPGAPFYKGYTIEPGDTLGRIARRSKTTVELLQKANRLAGEKILVGHALKVPTVAFSVVVDKSQNTLTLKADEEVVKTYGVSTGKDNQTPVGTFTIVNKLVDPPWYTAQGVIPPGSPENILGTRWLGVSKPGYGIHGTTDPGAIGQSVTAGCVRMRNAEVEELYALLPMGTDVTIVD